MVFIYLRWPVRQIFNPARKQHTTSEPSEIDLDFLQFLKGSSSPLSSSPLGANKFVDAKIYRLILRGKRKELSDE